MNKKQRMVLFGGIAVVVCLIGLVIALIINNASQVSAVDEANARVDSLTIVSDQLRLTNEFNQLNSDFSQYEDQQVYLKNDSLVQKYNAARMKVEGLLQELEAERKKGKNSAQALAQSRKRIAQLEGEISTLKGIVKHYLEEIKRLSEENDGLKREIAQVQERNSTLTSQVTAATASNAQLSQTVQLAKKLNITGVSLSGYNKKGKAEKNVTKVRSFGVNFTISPNATAAPGMKDIYIRILSPEGALLGRGPAFTIDGKSVASSGHKKVEYANDELHVTIYADVNTTLTPGEFTVEVFCDGYRLASRKYTLTK